MNGVEVRIGNTLRYVSGSKVKDGRVVKVVQALRSNWKGQETFVESVTLSVPSAYSGFDRIAIKRTDRAVVVA